jgi:hypothetical protein
MFWLVPIETPGPGVPPSDVDANLVTPGVWGFVITFALAVIVVLLIVDMVRRTRRVRYRAEANERLDAEEAGGAERSGADGSRDPGSPS